MTADGPGRDHGATASSGSSGLPGRARLFAAVWPPPDVVDAVAALARPDVPGLRWTRPDQWHVTLVFLGTSDVEPTVERFRRTSLPPGPVTATLGPATGRFGRRVVHVPVAGLDGVAAAVRAELPGEDDRPFTGHLTLARAKGAVDLSSVVGVPLTASFPVSEVTLVLSELGRGPGGGARYRVLDRLQL